MEIGNIVIKNAVQKFASSVAIMKIKVSSIVISWKNGEIENYIGNFVHPPTPLIELVLNEIIYNTESNKFNYEVNKNSSNLFNAFIHMEDYLKQKYKQMNENYPNFMS